MSSRVLADLRARGVVLEGGVRLRVRCPVKALEELRPLLEAHRDELLDALQEEAEEAIAKWPQAYRRWPVQTIGYAVREGFSKREAYRDVRAALAADRARVIVEATEDRMLRAALGSGLLTVDEVAAT